MIPLQKMTDIFKRLIQEQVSIKDLRTILEALSEWAQSEKDMRKLAVRGVQCMNTDLTPE